MRDLKVWVDVLTPKQLLFFRPLVETLRKRHHVLVTSRRYRELDGLARTLNFQATVIGRHGGASLEGKLRASAERTVELVKIVSEWQPDVAVSASSPECARVAYGLGIPHICCSDTPHAESVCRLTLPLATRLAAPWIIPFREWARYGLERRQWKPYRAIDPAAWLKNWRFQRASEKLGLTPGHFIVFRPESTEAAHLKTKDGGKRVALIRELCRLFPDHQVLVLPRYEWQLEEARGLQLSNLVLAEQPVPAPDLLVDAALFVGRGGTMSAEAALLGVPTISLYPDEPTYIDRYLMRRGLLERVEEPTELAARALELVKNEEARRRLRERARRLLDGMQDPTQKIRSLILSMA